VSPRLKLYVAAVTAAAFALLWTHAPLDLATRGGHYLGWIVICALSERMCVTMLSGTGTVTMASTAGLAAALLWGQNGSMAIAAVSTAIAELFLLRKPPIRVLFNTCQIAITMWAAVGVFGLLGGPVAGVVAAPPAARGDALAFQLAIPVLGMFAAYLLVNRLLIAVAVAWSTERRYVRVLREDWFTVERLLQDLAAFLLSPLMALSFVAIGYLGVPLFFGPLWLLHESFRRYLDLQRAQQQMIHTERMAAKGEMAAEVGHELRNQLAAISGRAQMLQRDAAREIYTNVARHAQVILDQSQRMERLSKGLLDFSGAELKIERFDLNGLVSRTIELMSAQNRFDGIEWEVALADPSPELRADPGQLQQVLINLLVNAADAMNEHAAANGGARKKLRVGTTRVDQGQAVTLVVQDTGPGIPKSNLAKIFEPHFTTKKDGHGFGLSTSHRIVVNHGGRIEVESPVGQGATFTVTLPLRGAVGWS
jgi:signal transduction histidine kinase